MIEELRGLIARVASDREAAVRLAQLIRREAMDDRNLVAAAHDEEPALGDALAKLVR